MDVHEMRAKCLRLRNLLWRMKSWESGEDHWEAGDLVGDLLREPAFVAAMQDEANGCVRPANFQRMSQEGPEFARVGAGLFSCVLAVVASMRTN